MQNLPLLSIHVRTASVESQSVTRRANLSIFCQSVYRCTREPFPADARARSERWIGMLPFVAYFRTRNRVCRLRCKPFHSMRTPTFQCCGRPCSARWSHLRLCIFVSNGDRKLFRDVAKPQLNPFARKLTEFPYISIPRVLPHPVPINFPIVCVELTKSAK